jgi:hypothetical protein
MERRCAWTVRGLTTRRSATSASLSPIATSRSTSVSRLVSPPGSRVDHTSRPAVPRAIRSYAHQTGCPFAVGTADLEVAVGGRQHDQGEASACELAQPRGDEAEQPGHFDFTREGVADLGQGLELVQPTCRRLVAPGILDGDGSL